MAHPNLDRSAGPTTAQALPSGHGQYRNQELVLYGSVKESFRPQLIQRLKGLCDPGSQTFHEHEMVFTLNVEAGKKPVPVRLRRRMHQPDANSWHCKYIGDPEADPNCPVIVRKVLDSMINSNNMMEFVKDMGLRMDYEYLTDGVVYNWGNIRVYLSQITMTKETGKYDNSNRERLIKDAVFVEAVTVLPEQEDYHPAAKQLRDFANQLAPLVKLEKFDYWLDN